MSSNSTYSDSELIRVIQILDAKGRRGTNNDAEGAAFVQIYQGDWVNIFSKIKENSEVKEDLNKILTSNDNNTIIDSINKLYRINPIDKLTGGSAVVINDLLFAYTPYKYTSVMSLLDRYLIIDYFGLVKSNKLVLSLGSTYGLQASAKNQAEFLYSPGVKKLWREADPYSDKIVGAIAYITFGDFTQVYSDEYIEEFIKGEWDQWNTPRDYMGSTPGILLLYDPEREGITIYAEVTGVKKQEEGNFPYQNAIDPDSVIVFVPPISKEAITNVRGLESFGKGQSPKYNLKQYMFDKLMIKYSGTLRSRVQLGQSASKEYSLQKDDDGIKIEDEGVDPQTGESVVKTRLFQSAFRNSILELFNHNCLLCDVDSDLLLEAAHITPFSEDNLSAGDFANGIALCTIHHILFDKGLISIKGGAVIPSKMLISTESDFLNEQYNELSRLSHVVLPKGEKSEKFLRWHYNNVFVKKV
jgi:hypothetical protein